MRAVAVTKGVNPRGSDHVPKTSCQYGAEFHRAVGKGLDVGEADHVGAAEGQVVGVQVMEQQVCPTNKVTTYLTP